MNPPLHLITDHGAVPDGTTNNAWAIQRAIDACAADGGGRVVVPSGTFLSGKIFLRSRIELHLAAGATLLCSPHIGDVVGGPAVRGVRQGFLCAEDAEDIAITGPGLLDGNGRSYVKERGPEICVMQPARPRTLVFMTCRRVTVSGLTVRDSAEWTFWFCGCTDLTVDGIRLENDLTVPNSDGLDIDHCRNVRITNCHLEAGDDTISIKTTRGGRETLGPCENILIRGCTLRSASSAVVIGCEIASPVRHIVVDSCAIAGSHRGLSINHSYDADIEDVCFSNITIETQLFDERWWGSGEPIFVKALPWTEKDAVGRIRDIRFENIRARGESGVVVWGERPDRIRNIVFENVRVAVGKWTTFPAGRLDLRPCPGDNNGWHSGVISRPAFGVLLHNAEGVTLRNFGITLAAAVTDPQRKPLVTENISGLVQDGFHARES